MSAAPAPSARLTVAIVDDEAAIRESLLAVLQRSPRYRSGAVCASAAEARRTLPSDPPHLLLLDMHLGGDSGIELLRWLKTALPRVKVVMLTSEQDDFYIQGALREGADGYLLKGLDSQQLHAALDEVARGNAALSGPVTRKVLAGFRSEATTANLVAALTTTERTVLEHMAAGRINKEIAAELGSSVETVRTHTRNLFTKLGVHNRTEAVLELLKTRRP
ncbi:MAG: hypothetical protein RL514_48 [Verrucomicrobiota bacterium]|jgi:DNA-binding NarL/FixJ family response regulator